MNNGKEIARIDKVDELQPALQFRSFYLTFSNLEILNTRVQNLSWTHFRSLLRFWVIHRKPVAKRQQKHDFIDCEIKK